MKFGNAKTHWGAIRYLFHRLHPPKQSSSETQVPSELVKIVSFAIDSVDSVSSNLSARKDSVSDDPGDTQVQVEGLESGVAYISGAGEEINVYTDTHVVQYGGVMKHICTNFLGSAIYPRALNMPGMLLLPSLSNNRKPSLEGKAVLRSGKRQGDQEWSNPMIEHETTKVQCQLLLLEVEPLGPPPWSRKKEGAETEDKQWKSISAKEDELNLSLFLQRLASIAPRWNLKCSLEDKAIVRRIEGRGISGESSTTDQEKIEAQGKPTRSNEVELQPLFEGLRKTNAEAKEISGFVPQNSPNRGFVQGVMGFVEPRLNLKVALWPSTAGFQVDYEPPAEPNDGNTRFELPPPPEPPPQHTPRLLRLNCILSIAVNCAASQLRGRKDTASIDPGDDSSEDCNIQMLHQSCLKLLVQLANIALRTRLVLKGSVMLDHEIGWIDIRVMWEMLRHIVNGLGDLVKLRKVC